ncbi:MAG: phosphotransferase [Dehalococcoidia bacterium]
MIATEFEPVGVLRSLGIEPDGACRRVEGGWATAIWQFKTADGKGHSLRVFNRESERVAQRERAAMSFAAGAGLPVPEVEAAGAWEGRPLLVLSWLPGVNLVEAAAKRPWQIWRLGARMGALQAKVHALRPPEELEADAPERWLGRIGAIHPEVRALVEGSLSDEMGLMHMDYHPLNLLTDGREITGILDWPTATAGDRRADLAMTTVLLKLAPVPPSPLRPVLKMARSLVHTSWRRAYTRAAGWPGNMAPFYAWAGAVFVNGNFGKVGNDGVWATEADFEPFNRWIAEWTKRARLA